MTLFGLFRKSPWKLLLEKPKHQLEATVVVLHCQRVIGLSLERMEASLKAETGAGNSKKVFVQAIGDPEIQREIELALLTVLSTFRESTERAPLLKESQAINVVGYLKICEFRNGDNLVKGADIGSSGFSYQPHEAKAQLLVLIAKKIGLRDLEELQLFDRSTFDRLWFESVNRTYAEIVSACYSGQITHRDELKQIYEQMSENRRNLLLAFTAGSRGVEIQRREVGESAPVPGNTPVPAPSVKFDLDKSKREHPFKYVPFPEPIYLLRYCSGEISRVVNGIKFDAYEVSRLLGAKARLSESLLSDIVSLDSDSAAYAMILSAVLREEPEFGTCGVGKKLIETFQSRNMKRIATVGHAISLGLISRGEKSDSSASATSIAMSILSAMRSAPFNVAKSRSGDGIDELFAGTVLFKHLLRYPRTAVVVTNHLGGIRNRIAVELDRMKNGKLLVWSEQEKLRVDE